MRSYTLDYNQIREMVKTISHPIHTSLNGAERLMEISAFIFITNNPFEDLMNTKRECSGVRDENNHDTGDALCKILRNCEIHFYSPEGEHYEMKQTGYWTRDIYAIRHK